MLKWVKLTGIFQTSNPNICILENVALVKPTAVETILHVLLFKNLQKISFPFQMKAHFSLLHIHVF